MYPNKTKTNVTIFTPTLRSPKDINRDGEITDYGTCMKTWKSLQ